MLEIEMPFLSYWLCYFLCRWSDSGCTCAFRCPERLSTDRNDSLCLPLNVSLTSTQVDGRYCPVLSLSWRTTTSPPLQSSGPSPQHYWPRFSLWSLSASATLSLLPQHESMSMALATSILIVVWQMLTDLSRVRKYRRLKPFLFITVVIMVNVYSTLNFRGPPTPFFFLSWVINQFVALTRLRLNLHHWSRFQWSPSLLSNQVEEPICQIHCMKVLFMPKVHFLKFIE